MLDIARLLDNALANNRMGLRKAAKQTLARAPLNTTVRELLASEAGEAIRELTISDLEEALIAASGATLPSPTKTGIGTGIGKTGIGTGTGSAAAAGPAATSADSQSREEFMYRRILEVLSEDPGLTIGQLAKRIDVDTTELRGYLSWMRRVGKISSVGRARATRYSLP